MELSYTATVLLLDPMGHQVKVSRDSIRESQFMRVALGPLGMSGTVVPRVLGILSLYRILIGMPTMYRMEPIGEDVHLLFVTNFLDCLTKRNY